jgi:hypothetical protein
MLIKNKIKTISHKNLFKEILNLPNNSVVVAEEAHLTPRTKLSKAQPFTEEELVELSNQCKTKNIEVLGFPQRSTPRALDYHRNKNNLTEESFPKSDDNDPVAIKSFLTDFPSTKLSKVFSDSKIPQYVRDESFTFTQDLNKHLNYARSDNYVGEDDLCANWILSNIDKIAPNISKKSQTIFGLNKKYKVNRGNAKKGEINKGAIKMTQLYSVVATLVNFDGSFKKRTSTGELPGWMFIKRFVIKMTPFHQKGGVARSNLYHHGVKNYFKQQCEAQGLPKPEGGRGNFSEDQDQLLIKSRKEYCDAIRELFQTCKKFIQNSSSHF